MPAILGISLGTWSVGFAVLSYGELIKWQVHSYSGAWNPRKAKCIIHKIQQYVDKNGVEKIAVKIPDNLFHISTGLQQLIGAINVLAEERGIDVYFYSLNDLKRYHSDAHINKKVLIDHILSKYPDLYGTYRSELKNKKTYYIKTFEAVACAHVCYKTQIDH